MRERKEERGKQVEEPEAGGIRLKSVAKEGVGLRSAPREPLRLRSAVPERQARTEGSAGQESIQASGRRYQKGEQTLEGNKMLQED